VCLKDSGECFCPNSPASMRAGISATVGDPTCPGTGGLSSGVVTDETGWLFQGGGYDRAIRNGTRAKSLTNARGECHFGGCREASTP
jgi:hypothetical protein